MGQTAVYQSLPITVVMATYNGERYLEQQLNSILSQTVKPSRIIISDDGSADNTIQILQKYNHVGGVRFSVNETTLGVIGNFKRAVSMVPEPGYVALSDQDDVWHPQKLQRLRDKLIAIDDGETPAMVYSDLTVIDKTGKVLNSSFWNELGQDGYRHCLQTLLYGNFVTGCTIMMNDKMAQHCKAMPDGISMHDVWLALIAFSFGKVDVIPDPLVYYRKHENNVAHSENFAKKGRVERWIGHIDSVLRGDKEYLESELATAEKFYTLHYKQLKAGQHEIFKRFLNLKSRSFLVKKLAFKRAFRGLWK